jgi:peptidyl-dipeptidase Dcp
MPSPATAAANPLLADWTTPFSLPPFAAITPEHFRPAFEAALATHRAELESVATTGGTPTFADTIEALELSGLALRRVGATFFNLAGTDTTPELQAIEREMAPVLARHRNAIWQDGRLFARIASLVERQATLDLSAEQARVLDRYHTSFVRNGAALDVTARERLGAVAERLATLGTRFAQNVLADEQAYALVLDSEADLAGLPPFVRDAAAGAAAARGLDGRHVVTLARSSIEPFLTFSARRDLREAAFKAWIARGENGGETDNRAIIQETMALRAERARLLGYPSFAHYRLADSMAGTPEAALDLLHSVWQPARDRALRDAAELEAMAREAGLNDRLMPWDWRFFAERRRSARFAIEPGEVEPYLPLDGMIEAAFFTANRLFGLSFTERHDLELHHPDARAWEVTDRDGRHVGLFVGDYFARSSKRSGAWASGFRGQEKLRGDIRPIIVNVMNFSKPTGGSPALLGLDDARTLFHEFGHALHGLLSDVTYPHLAGTSVDRDFVEFPSQVFEHWLEVPEVLNRFARHHRTGEPMPESLVQRLKAARNADQGFATVEYTACALVDLDLHLAPQTGDLDIGAFERASLERIGMPEAIVMRHRPPHFAHVFSGGGYASGYYSYMWSEVLDADGFRAFEEAGDPFDSALAKKLLDHVYAAGNKTDPVTAYRAFRGRDADPKALIEKRGLHRPPELRVAQR